MEMSYKVEFQGKILGYNQRYQFRRSKKLSPDYVVFKETVGWTAKSQNKNIKLLLGRIEIIIFYNSHHDTDNISKALLDGLENVLFKNDRQVDDLRVKRIKTIEPGFVLYCRELPEN